MEIHHLEYPANTYTRYMLLRLGGDYAAGISEILNDAPTLRTHNQTVLTHRIRIKPFTVAQ